MTNKPDPEKPEKKRGHVWSKPGLGREPMPPEERLVKITAWVTREDLAKIKALGEGYISLGMTWTDP